MKCYVMPVTLHSLTTKDQSVRIARTYVQTATQIEWTESKGRAGRIIAIKFVCAARQAEFFSDPFIANFSLDYCILLYRKHLHGGKNTWILANIIYNRCGDETEARNNEFI